ncbi:MAG: T9SS type A sorting domain-containing protein [Bacillota bacterium]
MKKAALFIFIILSTLLFGQNINWKTYYTGPYYGGNLGSDVIDIFSPPSGKVYIFYQTQSGILASSADNGNTWSDVILSPRISLNSALVCANGKIAASAYGSGNLLTLFSDNFNDSSRTWKTVMGGLPAGYSEINFISDSGSNIYAVLNPYTTVLPKRIYYLADKDTNWVQRYNGLPDTLAINTLITKGENTVFLGTNNQGIYRSDDKGSNWLKVSTGPKGWNINSFLIVKGEIYTASNLGVFVSKDNGLNWIAVNNGLPSGSVWSIVLNKDNNIFALASDTTANTKRIYYSSDMGQNWSAISNPAVKYGISKIAVNSNGYLFAIDGNAIHYTSSPVTEVKQSSQMGIQPELFSLSQNYPNPFNPATSISYRIPEAQHVRLTINDILGKEVRVLVNENKASGSYSVQFNAGNLPSGLYIYTLEAGIYKESRKLLLLK